MRRVRFSRWINHRLLGGSPNEMISSRAYREPWYCTEMFINIWWYWIFREKYHCHCCYQWEKNQMTENFQPYVPCEHCGRRVFHTLAVKTEKYFGEEVGMKSIYFCNEAEANEWYLEQLRRFQE